MNWRIVLLVAALCPPPQPHDYAAQARAVVGALASRRFDEVFADFNATHGPNLSPRSIANGWDQVLATSGPFQEIEAVQVADRRYHVATVACRFERESRNVLIYLDDDGRIAGLNYAPSAAAGPSPAAGASWTAPAYADQSTFHELSVTVSDGQWTLPGTLALPNGNGPHAAVVLISGSGPNDADATFGPNKVSKDLAWGLASKSIAVLRYPKRTRVYGAASSPDPRTFTVKDESLDDARAAVRLLASRPEIDAKRIFVAGHSIPIYVAQGGRDYQVTAVDYAGWQRALAGHSNATLKLYPSLDHLLVSGVGPSTPAQYLEGGRHVSAEIIADLARWIAGVRT